MDLRVLRYFVVIATEENITKAAELLHITQPTLSRQIMALEEEVGAALFNRKNHSISLTDAGRLFLCRASEIQELAERSKKEIAVHKNLSGTLALGAGEYGSSEDLAKLLCSFQKKYPDVELQVFEGNADSIKEKIEQGLLDFGHLTEPVEVLKYDYLRFPRAEEFGVFVNSKSPLTRLKFITPADCVKEPLVISSRLLVQKEIKSWLGTFAEEVKISATVNLPFHSIQLVRQGSGIAFTLKRNEVFEGVKFLTLEPKLPIRTILVWKKNQILSPVATAFLEFVKGSME